MSKRVLVVSSANMDIKLPIREMPAAGETLLCDGSVSYSPGGKGANSAVTFAALGAETVLCARIGRDSHGESLYDFYKEKGIDVRHIAIDREQPTGCAVVFVDNMGQNRILAYPGANSYLSERDVDEGFLSCPDALYLQMEIGQNAFFAAANYAHRHDIPIFVDAGPARADFPFDRMPPVKVFSPNETETEIYTGITPDTPENCKRAAIALLQRVKAKYIVLKLGARGVGIYDAEKGGEVIILPTYPIKVVDSVAAGDAFTAALTLEYIRSGDIYRAARFGNVVGTLTVSKRGAGDSIPTAAECDAFMAERGIEL